MKQREGQDCVLSVLANMQFVSSTPMLTPNMNGAYEQERKLSIIQCHVIQGGTEPPFTGRTVNGYKYNNNKNGTYECAVCGLPAYSSRHKFESGTGWPSFYKVRT